MAPHKNLLVTGAGGYIGTKVVEKALEGGRAVVALDTFYFGEHKLTRYADSPHLTIVHGDIREIGQNVFKGIDEVISLAGISNDPACDLLPEITLSTNRDGCIRIAKLAKQAGVQRYLDMSSCSVYGAAEDDICDETSTPHPISLYARCKLEVEDGVLNLADSNFCITSLRNSTTFGPSERMRFDLVVNIMTLHALMRRFIKISGDGTQGRPLIHVEDTAEACLQLLECDPSVVNEEVFNLIGFNLEIRDVATKVQRVIQEIIQEDVRMECFPQDFDVRNYQVDGDKLKAATRIVPKRSVEVGIREIAEGVREGRLHDHHDCYTVQFYKSLFANR